MPRAMSDLSTMQRAPPGVVAGAGRARRAAAAAPARVAAPGGVGRRLIELARCVCARGRGPAGADAVIAGDALADASLERIARWLHAQGLTAAGAASCCRWPTPAGMVHATIERLAVRPLGTRRGPCI